MARRILLVEDNELLVKPLLRLFGRAGYKTHHVGACMEARSLKDSFNIGVLDLELPDGIGTDLCVELLDSGTISCVVFFTGSMDEGLLARARRFGTVVGKSEGAEHLLVAIRTALASRPRQAAGGEDDTAPSPSSPRRSNGA